MDTRSGCMLNVHLWTTFICHTLCFTEMTVLWKWCFVLLIFCTGEEKTKTLFGKPQKDVSEKTSPRRRQLIKRGIDGYGFNYLFIHLSGVWRYNHEYFTCKMEPPLWFKETGQSRRDHPQVAERLSYAWLIKYVQRCHGCTCLPFALWLKHLSKTK